jgi:hypothetical protein
MRNHALELVSPFEPIRYFLDLSVFCFSFVLDQGWLSPVTRFVLWQLVFLVQCIDQD